MKLQVDVTVENTADALEALNDARQAVANGLADGNVLVGGETVGQFELLQPAE
jgi:hypothetical protein